MLRWIVLAERKKAAFYTYEKREKGHNAEAEGSFL
jgi:hypothetical protein